MPMRKLFLFSFLSLSLLSVRGASGPLQAYDVKWYFLELEVNDTNTFLRGAVHVQAVVVADSLPQWVLELTDSLQVDSIHVNGLPASFVHIHDSLEITLVTPAKRGDLPVAEVWYHGTAPTGGFFSAVTSKEDETWHQRVTWTLSEPYAAREWFPCKQSLTDKADSSAVWITVDSGLVAGSNGVLEGVDTLAGGTRLRYRWHHHHPIDYYLISFAVSPYREVNQYAHNIRREGDSLLIQNFIYRDEDFLQQNRENMEETPRLLELYSHLFGPYPFDDEKYGHCLAPMGGGMEHQTMTTLAGLGFTLVSHEMAHQWFGDYVTCATWQDIWINEGFASYVEYLALEHLKSLEEAREWMDHAHSEALKEPDGSVYVPLDELDNLWRIFSGRLSYKKGASLLHMIRYELQDDTLFFHVLKTYLQEFGDSTATGKDFEGVLEQVSGKDFGWFFDQWYYGTGYPDFDIGWWQKKDTVYIRSVQSPSGATPFFRTHIDFRLETSAGDTLVRFLQDEPEEVFRLPFGEYVNTLTMDPEGWLLFKLSSLSRIIDPEKEGMLIVYPNPTDGMIRFHLPGSAGELYLEITDLTGRKVMEKKFPVPPYRFDASVLPDGAWIFRLVSGHYTWVRKVIVNK